MSPELQRWNQVPADIQMMVREFLAHEGPCSIATLVNVGMYLELSEDKQYIARLVPWGQANEEELVAARRSSTFKYSVKPLAHRSRERYASGGHRQRASFGFPSSRQSKDLHS